MDPLTVIAIIQGAIKTVEIIRSAIRNGKGPAKPDGSLMTEADLDSMVTAIRAEIAEGKSIAQAELDKLGGG